MDLRAEEGGGGRSAGSRGAAGEKAEKDERGWGEGRAAAGGGEKAARSCAWCWGWGSGICFGLGCWGLESRVWVCSAETNTNTILREVLLRVGGVGGHGAGSRI